MNVTAVFSDAPACDDTSELDSIYRRGCSVRITGPVSKSEYNGTLAVPVFTEAAGRIEVALLEDGKELSLKPECLVRMKHTGLKTKALQSKWATSAACERLAEREANHIFRNGDYWHTFEYGQTIFPRWRGRGELEVLLERVELGLKPLASFVLQPGKDMPSDRRAAIRKAESRGLSASTFCNSWGVWMLHAVKYPEQPLGAFLSRCEKAMFARMEPNLEAVLLRPLGHFLCRDCDMASPVLSMPLECAIVFGYPFSLAISRYREGALRTVPRILQRPSATPGGEEGKLSPTGMQHA
jgi:hypothetical protein